MTKKMMRLVLIICLASLLAAGFPSSANGFVLGSCRWSEMQILRLTYGNGNLTDQNWDAAKLSILAWSNIAPQINLVEAREGEIPNIVFQDRRLPNNDVGYSISSDYGGRCRAVTIVIDEEKIADYGKQRRMQLLGHEFGHALGVDHSDKPRSIMSINYDPYSKFNVFVAGRDEFYALEQLYGQVGDGNIWRDYNNHDY